MARYFSALVLAAMMLAVPPAAQASSLNKKTEADIGRAISIALPLAAYGISYAHDDDWAGMEELSTVTGLTVGAALLTREFVRKRSPDGSSDRSFPSIEAALATPAEGYLWRRYGWEYGLPAFVLSHGASLLLDDAGKHRFVDGLAVTAVAAVLNWGITTEYHDYRWSYGASVDANGVFVGIHVAM